MRFAWALVWYFCEWYRQDDDGGGSDWEGVKRGRAKRRRECETKTGLESSRAVFVWYYRIRKRVAFNIWMAPRRVSRSRQATRESDVVCVSAHVCDHTISVFMCMWSCEECAYECALGGQLIIPRNGRDSGRWVEMHRACWFALLSRNSDATARALSCAQRVFYRRFVHIRGCISFMHDYIYEYIFIAYCCSYPIISILANKTIKAIKPHITRNIIISLETKLKVEYCKEWNHFKTYISNYLKIKLVFKCKTMV